MNREEAIRVIKNEIACVGMAEFCNRDCEKCKLVMETKGIIEAYEMAISALELMPLIDKFKELEDTDKVARLLAMALEPCKTSTDEPMTMVYPTIFCDDTISRQDVINAIENEIKKGGLGSCFASFDDSQKFRGEIEQLPSVQPTSNTQKDVEKHVESALKKRCEKAHEMIEDRLHCSCGIEWIITGRWDEYNYCPNCGTKIQIGKGYER